MPAKTGAMMLREHLAVPNRIDEMPAVPDLVRSVPHWSIPSRNDRLASIWCTVPTYRPRHGR